MFWENFIGVVVFGAFCYGLYRYVEYRKAKNAASSGSGGGSRNENIRPK